MKMLFNPSITMKRILILAIVVLSLLVTVLVYVTGGIQFAYSHAMYVPVIIGAIMFGILGGALSGFLGGLLLGPLMPISVAESSMQDPINWLTRMFFFVLIGIVTGYIVKELKQYFKKRIEYHSHLPDARIPLITRLYEDYENAAPETIENSALIYIKVLNYNNLNDYLGHQAYIKLLGNLFIRLNKALSNQVMIYSKDIQSLIITIRDKHTQKDVVEHIESTLIKPFYLNNIPVHLETVIGAAEYDETIDVTIQHAIKAARSAEHNFFTSVIYHEDLEVNQQRINLGFVLDAIRDDDFYLLFQPQYNTDQTIICLEALIRWNHKNYGNIPPNEFIPLIEQTSLINPLTEWVIKTALKRLHELKQHGHHIKIAINISTKNLYYKDFYANVKAWLEYYEVSSDQIEFEITESTLMHNPKASEMTLHALKDLGVQLSIDDFGTGYSNLSYLSAFSVQKLKIDRSFIAKMSVDASARTIIETAINLASGLNIETVAEGVETSEQLTTLKTMGCHYVQGFYLSKPLAYDDVLMMLNQ